MGKKVFFALFILLACVIQAAAQEVEVDRYTVNARIDLAASALEVRASLAVTNLGQAPKSRLFLRLVKQAKVSAVAVNGAPAQFEVTDDRRTATLSQLSITTQNAIAAGAKGTIDVTYRIDAQESTPLLSVYQGEVLMLPDAVWVPMPSTMFTLYGATTAPCTLTVTASSGASSFRVASSGGGKAEGQTFTFEQSLNTLPLIVAGNYESPNAFDHGGIKVELYVQPGLGSGEKPVAALMSEEAKKMIDFFTRLLGAPPVGASLRIISSVHASNVIVPGAIVLNEQVFRQDLLDAVTLERLADAVARLWLEGRVRLRGQETRAAQGDRPALRPRSPALLRDSLPRYLTTLFFEDRYGKEAASEALSRMRWSYTPVAQSGRDGELGLQTLTQSTYGAAAFGKGPLVLRLLAETAGRDKFIAVVRALFGAPQTQIITLEEFRQALVKAGSPEVEKLYQQWVEAIIEPDVVIGIPQPSDKPGAQRVNLRNLGTGDVAIKVLALTQSGKPVSVTVAVPSESLVSAEIPTAETITSVEADPDKLLVQTNYDNDAKPVRISSQTLFTESIAAFNKGEFTLAEAKLREALRTTPNNALLRAWLGRALAAQNKGDEAIREANAALKIEPPTGGALAWAHITLGQVYSARGQQAEAARHLRRAAIEADEAPAQFAASEALIKVERAAGPPQVEDSIRSFITQLDSLIKQPSSDKLFSVVIRNNLKKFVQGLTITPPTAWTTEILRVDQIDANRVALDVGLRVRTQDAEPTGTALFILYRSTTGWMLEEVQRFNVR